MSTQDDQKKPLRWKQVNVEGFVWFLFVPVLSTLDVVFEGGSWTEIGLTLLSGSALGCAIGFRFVWSRRHPLDHEQSHIKLTILVSVVLWTAFLVGAVLIGGAKGEIDRLFWEHVLFLVTVGQLFMVALGAIWGTGIRTLDWYPLRRTRASVIRLVAMYLTALILVSIASILMLDAPQWQRILGTMVVFLVWLTMARLWRG